MKKKPSKTTKVAGSKKSVLAAQAVLTAHGFVEFTNWDAEETKPADVVASFNDDAHDRRVDLLTGAGWRMVTGTGSTDEVTTGITVKELETILVVVPVVKQPRGRKMLDAHSEAEIAKELAKPAVPIVSADQLVETATAKEVAHDNGAVAPPNPANLAPVARGLAFHKMAGNPSRPAVISCFGKTGYALSWVARAAKLGITTEELIAKFKADPDALKAEYAAAATKTKKA